MSNTERNKDDRKPDEKLFLVTVNGQPVRLLGHVETGREIKVAAIEQGVEIHLSFILEEELEEGKSRVVEDDDKVKLRDGLVFKAHPHKHEVTLTVNEQPVNMEGHEATGLQIKEAAIAQHVHIQINFVLQEELPNGTSRIIGDADRVHLRNHLKFTAIAPDDNS